VPKVDRCVQDIVRTNRDKVSVWNCGIFDISWRLEKKNISAAPRNACEWLNQRSRDRFRISNVRADRPNKSRFPRAPPGPCACWLMSAFLGA
jgi:hypothetical protein